MIPTALKIAVLAALFLPTAASAATIQLGSVLKYEAAPGEENRVRVSRPSPNQLAIRDTARITSASSACTPIDSGFVCPFATTQSFHLGDRNDEFTATTGGDTYVFAGVGDDRYLGGHGPASRTSFEGQDGHDTVSYEAAASGVRVSLDNARDDGRSGDQDVIDSDVERVIGSNFRDELSGTFGSDVFHPLDGDDLVTGKSGADVVHMNAKPDGADAVDAGVGPGDVVSYAQRTTRVEVTPGWNGHDDGAPGERDEIVGAERIEGGSAGDLIDARVGPPSDEAFGKRYGYELVGGDGADTLLGSAFRDVLVGGPHADVMKAFDDNDILDSRDGVPETLECGAGTSDTAMTDVALGGHIISAPGRLTRDRPSECESSRNVLVGVGRVDRVAVARGAVSLRVAWTHPRRWKDLRRIEVRLLEGERVVGRDGFIPRSGVRGRVSRRLRIAVPASLEAGALAAEVSAVDRRGRSESHRVPAAVIVAR
jgi:hypothetical protein